MERVSQIRKATRHAGALRWRHYAWMRVRAVITESRPYVWRRSLRMTIVRERLGESRVRSLRSPLTRP